jgi:3-oxoacyl-(acyl-carrier-protein) synthase
MNRRRVKITGIGPVTPAGIGKELFWKGILEPVSRVRPFTKLEPELGPFVAAFIEGLHIDQYVPRASVPKGSARHTLFAIAGAALALRDAGMSSDDFVHANTVVVAGACVMDFEGIIRTVEAVTEKGVRGAQGRAVYTTNAAAIAATVGEVLGIPARTMSVQSSCCTGLDAIGHAARLVGSGEADIAICGGTDAPLFQCPLVELRAVGMTPDTTDNAKKLDRPFDMWRTTGVVSEGACMFVIETETSPRPGYSFVTGYAYSNDRPKELCSGMAVAMKQALADANIRAAQVECISAWGPGHRLIDAAEARMLDEVFGKQLAGIPALSIKGSIGNPLGAAGAIQVAAAALSQKTGYIPPTVNWQFPDPDCPLNLCANQRHISHDVTLVNAHGLSGVNSSLILHRC